MSQRLQHRRTALKHLTAAVFWVGVYFQLLKWAVLLWMRRLTLVLKELKFKFIFSNIHTRFWVIPKWMGRPKCFVAQIAGILQALNVLLNVLFHMTKHLRCVVAVGAFVPFSSLFDHWLNSCHGIRWNNWILLQFLVIWHHSSLMCTGQTFHSIFLSLGRFADLNLPHLHCD